jgi:cytochrome c peroxidase
MTIHAGRLGAIALGLLATAAALDARATDPSVPSLRLRALARTGSLKSVLLQFAPNRAEFVVDEGALQVLGKALYWDQQVGSDGQACASCHYHAGADARSRNQLNPGSRNQSAAFPNGDTTFGNSPLQPASLPPFKPDYQLSRSDFPLHSLANPADATSAVLSDTNDVVSSQGSFNANFLGIAFPGDLGQGVTGGPFAVNGALVRSVPPRNAPTTVNAVFNRRNFWDSRARDEFNGVNPFGDLDPNARVVKVIAGVASLTQVRIPRSSAASQAVGPPLSNVEMSFAGRTFAQLGRRVLAAIPLDQQVVARDDSLLGPWSFQAVGPGLRGLTISYAELVARAIAPAYWDAPGWRVDVSGPAPQLVRSDQLSNDLYTVMEYNFSLVFGLAIDAYERTLRADDTPFDRFLEGDPAALSDEAQNGLEWFLGVGRCIGCHSGPELTNQGVSRVDAAKARTADQLDPPDLERMIMADSKVSTYDAGSYNIGVRPSDEDVGVAGTGGDARPLSNVRGFQVCVSGRVSALLADPAFLTTDAAVRQANVDCGVPHIRARPLEAATLLSQASALLGRPLDVDALLVEGTALVSPPPFEIGISVPPNFTLGVQTLVSARDLLAAKPGVTDAVRLLLDGATSLLPDPLDPGPDPTQPFGPPLRPDERVAVKGAFKAPGLRNVELTAPYFHNGGQATLDQVVEFYDRGGDFHDANGTDADALVAPIGLTERQRAELVAFLKALTDERVRWEQAPFDHPSLSLPNGAAPGSEPFVLAGVAVVEDRVELPAIGAGGSAIPLGTPGTPFANFPDPLRLQLVAAAGNGQTGVAGVALAAPLVAVVRDDAGVPLAGVPLVFDAPAGASVNPTQAITGADGTATTTATPGPGSGDQVFTARRADLAGMSASFTVHVASTDAPKSSGGSSGGCGTGSADLPSLVALGLLAALRRRRS